MQEPGASRGPFGPGGTRRRRLFDPAPSTEPALDSRLETTIAAYHQVVVDQLEEGLRTIRETAVALMREIAEEVWRAAGASGPAVQSRILAVLSRDQAIRGLIAHSDERYQALDIRVAHMEASLGAVEESGREIKDLVARGVQAVRAAAPAPSDPGTEELRTRLSSIEQFLQEAIRRIGEREDALLAALRRETGDQGVLIREEIARIIETVREDDPRHNLGTGASPNGNGSGLAAGEVVDRITETVTVQVQAVSDRIEDHARVLSENLAAHEHRILDLLQQAGPGVTPDQAEAIRSSADEVVTLLSRSFRANLIKLAQLMRSDTEWTQRRLSELAADQNRELATALDARLGRVSEAVTAAADRVVEELSSLAAEQTARAVRGGVSDLLQAVTGRIDSLDRSIDVRLERLESGIHDRTARAVDAALAPRLEAATHRLAEAVDGMGRTSRAEVGRLLDARIGALARLIRSDNRILAERLEVVEEQDAAKQAARAVKELAAALPEEIAGALDRRFAVLADLMHRETQSTIQSVASTGDAVAQRVDRAAASVGERLDRDLDGVIDRLGDAMDALATGWVR
jgi:hypothetical protein